MLPRGFLHRVTLSQIVDLASKPFTKSQKDLFWKALQKAPDFEFARQVFLKDDQKSMKTIVGALSAVLSFDWARRESSSAASASTASDSKAAATASEAARQNEQALAALSGGATAAELQFMKTVRARGGSSIAETVEAIREQLFIASPRETLQHISQLLAKCALRQWPQGLVRLCLSERARHCSCMQQEAGDFEQLNESEQRMFQMALADGEQLESAASVLREHADSLTRSDSVRLTLLAKILTRWWPPSRSAATASSQLEPDSPFSPDEPEDSGADEKRTAEPEPASAVPTKAPPIPQGGNLPVLCKVKRFAGLQRI